MNHYIFFEFHPGCKLTDETKDRLLGTLLIGHFSEGLRELFSQQGLPISEKNQA
jgi:hypothetical protein